VTAFRKERFLLLCLDIPLRNALEGRQFPPAAILIFIEFSQNYLLPHSIGG
jgi:hypothetical protein